MQRFAVLRYDRRERYSGSVLQGDAFDRPGDFAFGNPRTAHAHRQAVHFAGGLAGPFDLFDLRRLFYLAQRDDGARQFRRSVGRQPVGADAEQSAHRRTGFAAIRRQEEDAAAFGDGRFDPLLQVGGRLCFFDADFAGQFGQGRLGPRPDNVFEGRVVAEQNVFAGIQIEQAGAARAVQPEKIQERAVLPESERIARIVGRRFVVAR